MRTQYVRLTCEHTRSAYGTCLMNPQLVPSGRVLPTHHFPYLAQVIFLNAGGSVCVTLGTELPLFTVGCEHGVTFDFMNAKNACGPRWDVSMALCWIRYETRTYVKLGASKAASHVSTLSVVMWSSKKVAFPFIEVQGHATEVVRQKPAPLILPFESALTCRQRENAMPVR